jgi:putative ABC transport system ATP-binding protein
MIPRKLQQILFQLSQLRKDANGSVHPVAIEAPVVQLHALSKDFVEAGRVRTVLDGIDLSIESGEFVALLGHSGSGKSTLLNLISGIEKPTSGSISIQDVLITELRERERTLFRRDYIGFVFQFFNLIPTLNVLENVTLPQELAGRNSHDLQASAKALLEQVDLADRCDTFPDRLSGGEQQRVAIARALIHDPMLLLADEPTGNLDQETGQRVLNLLLELTQGRGKTLILATHNPEITQDADRILRVHEGTVAEEQSKRAAGYA